MAEVSITRGRGKLRGRHCVVVKIPCSEGGSKVRRFMGCFVSASKARSAAASAARKYHGKSAARFGGGRKHRRRRSRK